MNEFLSSLSSVLQILLVLLVLGIGFAFARRWRIRKLRALVLGAVPLKEEFKQAISKILSSDVLEVATLGAVTYVDMAWQYSLADPHIWTHLDGASASRAVDALADPHLLASGLGDHAPSVLGHISDYVHQAAAMQAFDHSLDNVMWLGADLPHGVLLLDGHPPSLVDILLHKGHAGDALADAKAGALLDAKASSLIDAKAGALLEAKAPSIFDAPLDSSDLWHHLPLITIGFAAYRAWRRAERGAHWGRNLEFAATEVVARSSGALAGAKVGGTVGTLVVPGYGTIIGSVVGAVSGAIAGARLSEEVKRRHIRQAQRDLDQALHNLGAPHLQDPVGYRRLKNLFTEQEKAARRNAQTTRRGYASYARWWRRLWPDQKLVLLQETVRESDQRLNNIHQQIRDTLERVEMLHQQNNYKALGLILWNAPGMCRQLGCAAVLVEQVDRANKNLQHELQQVSLAPTPALG